MLSDQEKPICQSDDADIHEPEENDSFMVDGTYADVRYEIKNELIEWYQEQNDKQISEDIIDNCATIITEWLIYLNADVDGRENYQRGHLLSNGRYYLRIDCSLFIPMASLVISMLSNLDIVRNAVGPVLAAGIEVAGVVADVWEFKDILKKVPEKQFCVLLCAHKQKQKQKRYVQLAKIDACIRAEKCPYYQLFRDTYGHFCENRSVSGKCQMSEDDIISHLRTLGRDFGIEEVSEGKLFSVK